jgi:phospholipase C
MYGVRGFSDPNVGIQANGLDLYHQPDSKSTDTKNGTKYLLPYQLQGARAGCTAGGSNMWGPFHSAVNKGKNDNWPNGNSPKSMGYLTRSQIPFLYSLADEFTIADMYFQSVQGSTNPNRVVWMSGTIQGPPNNYVLQDNSEATPFEWSTYPEALTNASVPWQLYQDKDNFDDNPLAWFKYWQKLPAGAEKNKGVGFLGLQAFYDAAAKGTLPAFSIIIGPMELSEHPTNTPLAGSWLQQQIVNAVMNSPAWNQTALFINYDEAGGYYDHVQPPQEPESEYVKDKFTGEQVAIGFGPRVPMVIVSPWTRGGNVFSEVSDHTSTLKFMEEFVGKDSQGNYLAPAVNVRPFARQTASNLVNAFDFENPDYSLPKFDAVPKPATLPLIGTWNPTEMCEINIFAPKTKPPYGKQTMPVVESGSRPIRGAVTEGRKIAITTTNGQAIRLNGTTVSTYTVLTKRVSAKSPIQFSKNSLFKLIATETNSHYKLESIAAPNACLAVKNETGLTSDDCKTTTIWEFKQNGGHHHIREVSSNSYLKINDAKTLSLSTKESEQKTLYKIYSVTESND